MNNGYLLAILGVLGIATGAAFYLMDFHKTIGLGGIGLGVILVLLGLWAARSMKPASSAQPAAPAQPAPAPS